MSNINYYNYSLVYVNLLNHIHIKMFQHCILSIYKDTSTKERQDIVAKYKSTSGLVRHMAHGHKNIEYMSIMFNVGSVVVKLLSKSVFRVDMSIYTIAKVCGVDKPNIKNVYLHIFYLIGNVNGCFYCLHGFLCVL